VFELETADARMLTDLGFISWSYGLIDNADDIFLGIRAARPKNEAGFIGGALVHLARGETEAAVNMLRSLPPTDAARTYLAMALRRSGAREEAHEILTDVANTGSNTPFVDLARTLLVAANQDQTPFLR
jgi:hypothetical protein